MHPSEDSGGSMGDVPDRIVCLTPETAEFLYLIGAADLVVGVSSLAPPAPDGVKRPTVSAFTTFRYDVIESLAPSLILAFSDLQAEAVQELARRGFPVFLTNQRTVAEVLATMAWLGRIVDRAAEAEQRIAALRAQWEGALREAAAREARPLVYFEEWFDPMITGIAWASELIAAAGGRDAFPELAGKPSASERIITPDQVRERKPDIIIASWCGKPANLDSIRARPGWDGIPAVRTGAVHEVKSDHCLRPGVSLITEGLPRFQAIVRQWREVHGSAPSR